MDEYDECGCSQATIINELCPKCRAEYEEYLRVMAMLRNPWQSRTHRRWNVPMRREVIRFDAEPVKVKLDKVPYAGIECHGQYGIDWRYSVNNGKAVMYLPEEARDALVQTGVAAGEEGANRRPATRRGGRVAI